MDFPLIFQESPFVCFFPSDTHMYFSVKDKPSHFDCIYISWFSVFCGLLCLVSHSECFVLAFVMWSALTRETCPVEGGLVMFATV